MSFPPNTRSQQNASFPLRSNRLGLGTSNSRTGMPLKDLTSDNGTTFAIGRKTYYALNSGKQQLLSSSDNSKFSKSGYNYIGSRNMQSIQNGKPIPNNSSDLYIERKRNLAIGRGSTQNKRIIDPKVSFVSNSRQNINTINQARHLCRNSGCVPSKKVANRIHNPSKCC
jgi:hypothetical protein